MPPPLILTDTHRQLVADYEASRKRAGMRIGPEVLWPAKAFCDRVGSPEGWLALSLEEQCGLHERIRTFVGWLIVTQRLKATPDYLIASGTQLGRIAAPQHPETFALLSDASRELGYSSGRAEDQWAALVAVAALAQVSPDRVTALQLRDGKQALAEAHSRLHPDRSAPGWWLAKSIYALEAILFHTGLIDEAPVRLAFSDRREHARLEWAQLPPRMADTMRTYLEQCALAQRPATVVRNESALRELGVFLAEHAPEVTCGAEIRRHHVEAYKIWMAQRPLKNHGKSQTLGRASIKNRLCGLSIFFERLAEWGSEDAPGSKLIFRGDLPILDEPLPRFLDDAAATKLLQAARRDDDPFVRLAVEMLARTGMRKGELIALTVDAVVQIGSAFWLRVPVGKLHTDRYIPLHPQLKALLDDWLAKRPEALRSKLLFIDRGRPIGVSRVGHAVTKVAAAAGIGHVSPHQLRHTLATQAINRGMSLEAIAALLGHKTLKMTMVYARIADRTVADEYFSVSEKVEALYDRPKSLPSDAEGSEMRKLRSEMHRRMLGNGYCARPVEMDCHFESICESCTFFVTTIEFRPTLERQRDDAAAKGQVGRQKVFDGLLARLDEEAS